jgi:hypothetical protein
MPLSFSNPEILPTKLKNYMTNNTVVQSANTADFKLHRTSYWTCMKTFMLLEVKLSVIKYMFLCNVSQSGKHEKDANT